MENASQLTDPAFCPIGYSIDSSNANAGFGNQLCMLITVFDLATVQTRYDPPKSPAAVCADATNRYDQYKTYYNFISNSVDGVYYVINDRSESFKTTLSSSVTSALNHYPQVDQFRTDSNDIVTRVTNKETGLPAQFDCSVLKTHYDQFWRSMCYHAAPSSF